MPKLINLLISGGPVMVPLIIAFIAVVVLAIERSLFWSRVKKHQDLTRTDGLPVNLPQAQSSAEQKMPARATLTVNEKRSLFEQAKNWHDRSPRSCAAIG
ncbi:MAG: hypothetical protein IGS48_14530 [Oscillatoriales cyanobacterium C42_A2020_001]|nr:hypothetical protein [Leptolyngbyaceae cyanobacterium C42_A2020_001]